jgi:hypothetical protein
MKLEIPISHHPDAFFLLHPGPMGVYGDGCLPPGKIASFFR